MIGDSFRYAKDGLTRNLATWIVLLVLILIPVIPFILVVLLMAPSLMTGTIPNIQALIGGFGIALIAAIILFAFYMGYQVKIFRGESPLPAVSGFGTLFADGIKYIVIEFIYFLPVLIILAITAGTAIMSALPVIAASPAESYINALLVIIIGVIVGIFIALIVAFILGLFAIIGIVRFARTGRMGEAFNFSEILATIGKIGWGTYIFALIIVMVLVFIVQFILGLIPYIGGIIMAVITPFISVFMTRYICLLYDSAGERLPSQVEAAP